MKKKELESRIYNYLERVLSRFGFERGDNSNALVRKFKDVLQIVSFTSKKGTVVSFDGWQVYIYLDVLTPDFVNVNSQKSAIEMTEFSMNTLKIRGGALGTTIPFLDLNPEDDFKISDEFSIAFESLFEKQLLLWLAIFSSKETLLRFKNIELGSGKEVNISEATKNCFEQFNETSISFLADYKVLQIIDDDFVFKSIKPVLVPLLEAYQFKQTEGVKYENLFTKRLRGGWIAAVMFSPINEIMLGVKCIVYCMGFSAKDWEEHRFKVWGIDQIFRDLIKVEQLGTMQPTEIGRTLSEEVMPNIISKLNQMLNKTYLTQYISENLKHGADGFEQEELIAKVNKLPEPSKIN